MVQLIEKPVRLKMTTERFVALAKAAHGDKYDYSKSCVVTTNDRVIVKCNVPGHGEWLVTPNNHISAKSGCPVCAGNRKSTTQAFISKARAIHGDKYDYSRVVYSGNKKDVRIMCSQHGEFLQTPNCHLSGQGCPKCAGKGVITTETFIRDATAIHGDKYDYGQSVFVTTGDKIKIRCKLHNLVFEQSYGSHIYQKAGCPECAGKTLKTTEKFIADATAVHGDAYDYSLVDYRGKARKVRIVCRKHGEFTQTPNSHLAGQGCPSCYYDSKFLTQEDFVRKAIEVHKGRYTYKNAVFKSTKDLVTVTCPAHGDWRVNAASHIYGGYDCPKCTGRARFTTEDFILRARSVHGETYSYDKVNYQGCETHVTITCQKHGDFTQTPDAHLQGKGCAKCANVGPSKAQLEISAFLSQYTDVENEVRLEGSRFRFDIYLPNEKIAVEYHGIYWHSSQFVKRDVRDFERFKAAESQGVRVIFIYEDEWVYQSHIVKSTLLAAIGKLPRLYARKCEVRFLELDDVRNFYFDHHIQHAPRCSVHVGLFHQDELVAAMSFGVLRSHRTNTDRRHWELVRYAASHAVIGGASRLLKAFISKGFADKITSYSDVRMFSGKMYERLGFTRTHQTPPDYHYVNLRKIKWREHKSKFQKARLAEMFPGCDIENKTEREICEENGYYQIYDCGKVRWDLAIGKS